MPDTRVAVVYARKSTAKQALSIERQLVACREWAAREGMTIALECVEEPTSGSTPIDRRPALCEALAALEDGVGSALIVDERSRLARDVYMAGAIGYEVRCFGAEIQSADGNGNGDSESALIQRTIEDLLAMLERRRIKRRTTRALAVLKANGKRYSRNPPFGWTHEPGPDGDMLVEYAPDQWIRRVILKMHAGGMSLRAICKTLGTAGLRPNSACWRPGAIKRIVDYTPPGS